MNISNISLPEVYKESADFRFFLKWFETALSKVQYDTENLADIYDPLRCPDWLLWMLADTMGFKYDNRLPVSFNRFVLMYFMSMIRNRGSKDGVTLAAEVNLKQFDIEAVAGTGYDNNQGQYVPPKSILFNRLEDTSIPVNSAYVVPHTAEGYIDIIYFADRLPVDACIEYVRPIGMYCLPHAGVRLDSRTKLSVDARLTNQHDVGLSIGPTHVGHYSRADYASLQRLTDTNTDLTQVNTSAVSDLDRRKGSVRDVMHLEWEDETRTARVPADPAELSHTHRDVWYRNADAESESDSPLPPAEPTPGRTINPGYRALYSLQLCNNEHIVRALIPTGPGQPAEPEARIFGLGWEPQDVTVTYPDDYKLPDEETPGYNLRYDKAVEKAKSDAVWTIEDSRTTDVVTPRPAVNPVMRLSGDAISQNDDNSQYMLAVDDQGNYPPQSDPTEIKIYNILPDGEIDPENND